MAVSVAKTFLERMLTLVGALVVIACLGGALDAKAETAKEAECFGKVQNKVAWNQDGATSWAPSNVQRLCKGVANADYLISCFSAYIEAGTQWDPAIDICQEAQKPLVLTFEKRPNSARPERKLQGVYYLVCYTDPSQPAETSKITVTTNGHPLAEETARGDCQWSAVQLPMY